MTYNLWFDFWKTELRSRNSYDIIDESVELDNTLSKSEKEIKENFVRDILIHRITNHYHNKISKIDKPRSILQILKEQNRLENNASTM